MPSSQPNTWIVVAIAIRYRYFILLSWYNHGVVIEMQ
jgi:hypothetical protein